jgi:hypothetical protein
LFYPAEFSQNSIPAAELWTLLFTHNTTLALCFYQQHFVSTSSILLLPAAFCSYEQHFVSTSSILLLPAAFCSYEQHFVFTSTSHIYIQDYTKEKQNS